MDTKQLSEILEEQAMVRARKFLDKARDEYMKAVNLRGTPTIVTTTQRNMDEEVFVDLYKFLADFTDQLMVKREQGIKAVAIQDFLKKFESFQSHMLTIEQYAQDMVDG